MPWLHPAHASVAFASLFQATTILGSTLALGQTSRVTDSEGSGSGELHRTVREIGSMNAAAPVAAASGDGEDLSLSGIFDDHSDDEVRNLKTLAR